MTPLVVAVIAPGAMGAAVGARLTDNGAKVITSLAGRSVASATRAASAGMAAVGENEIAQAELLLSIVPPGEALPLAERLAPALRQSNHKPLYVDCNAINPQTVGRIAAAVAEAGCPFVDAGIIGGPPRAGYAGPSVYVSGPESKRAGVLGEYGLLIRHMDGAVGDASALKMSYGGLTKGLTALGSALALAAGRAGVAEALQRELATSQPALLAYLSRSVPDMFSKAYRWVAEMEEIARFVDNKAEREAYESFARLYERLAADAAGSREEVGALAAFFAKREPAKPS